MEGSQRGRIPAKWRPIADALRAEIDEGRLKPGDQLPGQADLMGRHQVSMATVVRALDELRKEGLVVTRPGLGTYVLEKQPSQEFLTVMRRLDELDDEVRLLRERLDAREGE